MQHGAPAGDLAARGPDRVRCSHRDLESAIIRFEQRRDYRHSCRPTSSAETAARIARSRSFLVISPERVSFDGPSLDDHLPHDDTFLDDRSVARGRGRRDRRRSVSAADKRVATGRSPSLFRVVGGASHALDRPRHRVGLAGRGEHPAVDVARSRARLRGRLSDPRLLERRLDGGAWHSERSGSVDSKPHRAIRLGSRRAPSVTRGLHSGTRRPSGSGGRRLGRRPPVLLSGWRS